MADDVLKTLLAEAYGEGPEAMRRVAEVILNRAAARGMTPEQVVREAHQFTGLTQPGAEARKTWSDPKALTAAQAAWELAQQPGDPTNGSDHYHTKAVSPGWASKMPSTGEYGSHMFYASRPIPPGDLPQVASLVDTVPRPAPLPATAAPNLAAMRANSSPSGGNGELQAALDRMAAVERNRVTPLPRPAQSLPSLTAPGGVNASVGGLKQDGTLAAALARRSMFGDDPGTPTSGPVVASIPTKKSSSSSSPMSYAAQDAVKPKATLPATVKSASSASDKVRGNEMQTRENAVTVASFPTTVGQPPATRKVQSVPVPVSKPVLAAIPQSYAGQDRALPSSPVQSAAAPKPKISASDMARGNSLPTGSVQDRLASSPVGLPSTYGSMSPTQVSQIGVGLSPFVSQANGLRVADSMLPKIPNIPGLAPIPFPPYRQVASQIDVVPLPKPRPLLPVPLLGMAQLPKLPPAMIPAAGAVAAPMSPKPVAKPQPSGKPTSYTPAGYTNNGKGKLTSKETGGVYYTRHL